MKRYALAAFITFSHCCVHSSLLSNVTPRYLVWVLKGTRMLSIISLFGILFVLRLLFVKMMTSVFVGLNFRPTSLPQSVRQFIIFCILLIMWFRFVPAIMAQLSSANPCPCIPNSLIISMAASKAIIQNFALQTPPCGKPILVVKDAVQHIHRDTQRSLHFFIITKLTQTVAIAYKFNRKM